MNAQYLNAFSKVSCDLLCVVVKFSIPDVVLILFRV